MKPEEIKSKIRAMYSNLGDDLDTFYAHVAPDFVFTRPPFPPVVGAETNRKADEAFYAAFSDNVVEIENIIVEGNIAVMPYTWQAVHTGVSPTLGIPPTGKTIIGKGCGVYRWEDDKLVEQWDYFDLFGLLQQVGVIPEMG